MDCARSSPETGGRDLAEVALADPPMTVRPHSGLYRLLCFFSDIVVELRIPVTESNRRPSPYHACRFRLMPSGWVGLPQVGGIAVSDCVVLRLQLPAGVVTCLVTGSEIPSPTSAPQTVAGTAH
jgi:hypothetical protein